MAQEFGYTNISIFQAGFYNWKAAGNETHTTVDYAASKDVILVDLREEKDVRRDGRIPGSINIPFSEFEDRDDEYPSYRAAPIVFYSDDPNATTEALKLLVEYYYTNVTLLHNWKKEWISAGHSLVFDSDIITEIAWQPPHAANAVSFDDIGDVIKPHDVIVDVREPKEYKEAQLPGSINIPLAQLNTKIPELVKTIPEGAFMYLHCKNGTRARGAYEVLIEEGNSTPLPNKVKFINDTIEFNQE